jgi:uncharacterized membrane protein YgaE (UPF0421/DUF939 family)
MAGKTKAWNQLVETIASISKVDFETRAVVAEIGHLCGELMNLALPRQDFEVVDAVMKIQETVFSDMNKIAKLFASLNEDFEMARKTNRKELIREAVQTAKQTERRIKSYRDSMIELRDKLKKLKDDNELRS